MNRTQAYEILAVLTLAISGVSIFLAIVGTVLQQPVGVAASGLCAVLFLVPGVYFFRYALRLRTRDIALAHVAAFASGRGSIRIEDLAEELHVPPGDAEQILRTAVREGRLRGRFVAPDRFVAEPAGPAAKEGTG